MVKRSAAYICILLCALFVLFNHSPNAAMAKDTDTIALLHAIQERNNGWSWFAGDWPLFNHFYRPLPTLTFQLDLWLTGASIDGMAWTNAAIAAFCTALTGLLGAKLLESGWKGAAAAALFACWTVLDHAKLPSYLFWGIPAAAVLALHFGPVWRTRKALLTWGAGWIALSTLYPMQPLSYRMLIWPPGRTASVMTVFALGALILLFTKGWSRWVSGALLALALASYEQAYMVPFIGLALLICFGSGPIRDRAKGIAAVLTPWAAATLAMAALRLAVVPHTTSRYQAQQFRDGPGVFLTLTDYAGVPLRAFQSVQAQLTSGIEILVLPNVYIGILEVLLPAVGLIWMFRQPEAKKLGALWGSAIIAMLPMAFLKPFEHYDYFPMTLRSIFAIALLCAYWIHLKQEFAARTPTVT